MTNGDTFYIKADGDIDAVAMWVTKNSNGHGFTVDDNGTYIRIRDIVSIEQCDKQKVPENCSTCMDIPKLFVSLGCSMKNKNE